MSVIGTYNGAQVIAFPTSPGIHIRQFKLDQRNTNAMQPSVFTGATGKILSWPGADFWSAEITFAQMDRANAAIMQAFLAETQGELNPFLLKHPFYLAPKGVVNRASKPVCSGVNNITANLLTTRGWKSGVIGLLAVGDFIQIGAVPTSPTQPCACRWHVVTQRVDSDANGNATLNIFPTLREAPADGLALIFKNPAGMWRLQENQRSVLSTESTLSSVTLKLVEAR